MLGNLFHFLGRLAVLNFVKRLLNVSAKYQLQEGIFADDLHKKVNDLYNQTRTVPLCKSKNLEILGQIFIIVTHSHIYPFQIGSTLSDNFS